jgi:hypothetical protein
MADKERITEQQVRDAHDYGTDSLAYRDIADRYDRQVQEDLVSSTASCLLRTVRIQGFTSRTPDECPVDGCNAESDKGSLSVVGVELCRNPVYKPQEKYPNIQ